MPWAPRAATIMASSSATVGMASAQARREATRAPAALAYSAQRAGSQPDSSPCTSAPPNASPAPRPQTTSTGCGGTTVAPSAVATSTPSPPIFTSASSTPRASSRAAASCGSLVPTATSTSARLPTVTVTWSSIASYSARASSGDGQNISRQSRSRMVQRPEPGSGRGRRGQHLELGGAGRLDAHAGAGHPEDRHVAHHVPGDVVLGEREVGRDRRPVERQRRVLRRVELAEHHRRLQPGRRADVRRVDAEPGQRLADVVAEAVRADLGEHRGPAAQPGGADRDVGRGAAQGLRERRDVLERHARLLGVEVDPDPADGQQLEHQLEVGKWRLAPLACDCCGPARGHDLGAGVEARRPRGRARACRRRASPSSRRRSRRPSAPGPAR